MRNVFLRFFFIGLAFVFLSQGVYAQGLGKGYCDQVVTKKDDTFYCKTVYQNLLDWYEKNNIEGQFSLNERLRYEEGVWSYTNWPLKILFTDALWEGLPQTGSYPEVMELQDLVFLDRNKDLLPNRVESINDYLLGAIEREIFQLKFRHPVKVANQFIVIKLEDAGWASSTLPEGAIGRAWVTEEGAPMISLNPYLGDATIEKTVAHELFHLIQFSYNSEFMTRAEELNFSEGTALWMERLLFEFDRYLYDKDYLEFFKAYYKSPQRSLFGTNPLEKNFQYGTVLWPIFLEQQFTPSIIKSIWEAYFEEVKATGNYSHALAAATDAVLKTKNSSLSETYRSFARWIFDKNQYRRDAQAFPDVSFYAEIKREEYPTLWLKSIDPLAYPSLFGSSFVKFETSGAVDDFYVNFAGLADAAWALDVFSVSADRNAYLKDFSMVVPRGTLEVQEIRIPRSYLKQSLVLIVSPVDALQLETTQNAFDFYFPFELQAGFGKSPALINQAPVMQAEPQSEELPQTIFSDIPLDHPQVEAISYLKARGIFGGYPDGTFKPHNTLNRAELMKILVREELPVAQYQSCFLDVRAEWFAPYICYAKSRGWVSGYPDGTFRPAQEVNRAEALKMAMEVLGIAKEAVTQKPYSDVRLTDWFAPYAATARQKGFLDASWKRFLPGLGMKRGVMSEILYKMLKANEPQTP